MGVRYDFLSAKFKKQSQYKIKKPWVTKAFLRDESY